MDSPALIRVPCPLCGGSRTRPERTVAGFMLERCGRCGFVFTNPQYAPAGLLDEYQSKDADTEIALYDRLMTPTMLAEHDTILQAVEALAPGRGRLLDFGCAAGHFFERAGQRGWEAHGVEVAGWARAAAARRGLRHLHVGLLADQHFADGFFDVVVASQVLEHLPTPRNELAEIRRILRPGGLLYANVPNYGRLSVLCHCDDFVLDTPMGHVNYFTPRTLRRMLAACGFAVLRTATYGGLKWENLLGRPMQSEVLDAYACVPAASGHPGPAPNSPVAGTRRRPLLKRVLDPFVRTLAYRLGHLGLNLEVFARRP
jgi:SAM-dependent methyltransferase